MKHKKNGIIIDLSQEKTVTLWQTIQLILICFALGAGFTILNNSLGFVIIGMAILILAFPIVYKRVGATTENA